MENGNRVGCKNTKASKGCETPQRLCKRHLPEKSFHDSPQKVGEQVIRLLIPVRETTKILSYYVSIVKKNMLSSLAFLPPT
jgi:hypothetical protein